MDMRGRLRIAGALMIVVLSLPGCAGPSPRRAAELARREAGRSWNHAERLRQVDRHQCLKERIERARAAQDSAAVYMANKDYELATERYGLLERICGELIEEGGQIEDATRARTDAEAAEVLAKKEKAKTYAPEAYARASSLINEGRVKLRDCRHAAARNDWRDAVDAFRRAVRQGRRGRANEAKIAYEGVMEDAKLIRDECEPLKQDFRLIEAMEAKALRLFREEEYKEATERYGRTEEHAAQALEDCREFIIVSTLERKALEGRKDADAAGENARDERADKRAPELWNSARELLGDGQRDFDKGEFEGALRTWNKAAREFERANREAGRARVGEVRDRYQRRHEPYEDLLSECGEDEWDAVLIITERARAAAESDRVDEAIDLYDQAARRVPEAIEAAAGHCVEKAKGILVSAGLDLSFEQGPSNARQREAVDRALLLCDLVLRFDARNDEAKGLKTRLERSPREGRDEQNFELALQNAKLHMQRMLVSVQNIDVLLDDQVVESGEFAELVRDELESGLAAIGCHVVATTEQIEFRPSELEQARLRHAANINLAFLVKGIARMPGKLGDSYVIDTNLTGHIVNLTTSQVIAIQSERARGKRSVFPEEAVRSSVEAAASALVESLVAELVAHPEATSVIKASLTIRKVEDGDALEHIRRDLSARLGIWYVSLKHWNKLTKVAVLEVLCRLDVRNELARYVSELMTGRVEVELVTGDGDMINALRSNRG